MRGKIMWALIAAGIPLLAANAGALRADESASATISVDSLTGPTYNYTITLTNTGDTNIGTFWYAWVDSPEYDFLQSMPTVTGSPNGWIAPVIGTGGGYDGYSIEWYNISGSPIAPGGSATFMFSSPDSPSVLSGDEGTYYNYYASPLPMQTSFIYQGFPQTDAGASFVLPTPTLAAPVPEPASLMFLAAGSLALLKRKPRRA